MRYDEKIKGVKPLFCRPNQPEFYMFYPKSVMFLDNSLNIYLFFSLLFD